MAFVNTASLTSGCRSGNRATARRAEGPTWLGPAWPGGSCTGCWKCSAQCLSLQTEQTGYRGARCPRRITGHLWTAAPIGKKIRHISHSQTIASDLPLLVPAPQRPRVRWGCRRADEAEGVEGCQLAAVLRENPTHTFWVPCVRLPTRFISAQVRSPVPPQFYKRRNSNFRVNTSTAAYIANFVRAIQSGLFPEEIHLKKCTNSTLQSLPNSHVSMASRQV